MKDHRLTPESTRRIEFDSREIQLGDGARWGLARPTKRLIPKFVMDLDQVGRSVPRVVVTMSFGYPPDIRGKIDDVMTACVDGSASLQASAFFSLASLLLRRSHHLSEADARELLSVSEQDVARLVREILAVVTEAEPGPEANVPKESFRES